MDKIQQEFETWLESNGHLAMKEENGEYSFQHTRFAFEAWKASRAALCAWKSVFDERPNPDFDPVIICFNDGEVFESEVDEDGIYCNVCGLEFSHWIPKSAIPNP